MQISAVLNLSVFTARFWEKVLMVHVKGRKGRTTLHRRVYSGTAGVWRCLWNSRALTTGQPWALGQELRKTSVPTSVTHYGATSYSSHTHRLFFWPNCNRFTLNYKPHPARCSPDRLRAVTHTVSDKNTFHTLINIWPSPGEDLWHRSWETRH